MVAENLTTYVSATTPPLSILLGNYNVMFIKCPYVFIMTKYVAILLLKAIY